MYVVYVYMTDDTLYRVEITIDDRDRYCMVVCDSGRNLEVTLYVTACLEVSPRYDGRTVVMGRRWRERSIHHVVAESLRRERIDTCRYTVNAVHRVN